MRELWRKQSENKNKLLAKSRAPATTKPCWAFLRFPLCDNGEEMGLWLQFTTNIDLRSSQSGLVDIGAVSSLVSYELVQLTITSDHVDALPYVDEIRASVGGRQTRLLHDAIHDRLTDTKNVVILVEEVAHWPQITIGAVIEDRQCSKNRHDICPICVRDGALWRWRYLHEVGVDVHQMPPPLLSRQVLCA